MTHCGHFFGNLTLCVNDIDIDSMLICVVFLRKIHINIFKRNFMVVDDEFVLLDDSTLWLKNQQHQK